MKSIKDRIADAAASYEACPERLSTGVTKFADALTASHSLTSRRYSVWKLLRLYVDEPFADALHYRGAWQHELLTNFKPSLAGRHPGPQALSALGTHRAPEDLPPSPADTDQQSLSVRTVINSLECWIQCLRMAVHSCYASHVSAASKRFAHALDLMREVLHLIKRLRPRYRSHSVFGRVSETTEYQGGCCELCWRPSMQAVDLEKAGRNKSGRLRTDRFCEVHNPGDPNSRYRIDLIYKEAFTRELQAVYGFEETSYAFELPVLLHPDEHMLRRLAYDRVHAKIRNPRSQKERSLKERVWILHAAGQTQSEIARTLGISRQAVSKTMQQLRSIWDAHQARLRDYLLP
jgi:Transcriptional regulator, contains sigma factor-related N-terminal domain